MHMISSYLRYVQEGKNRVMVVRSLQGDIQHSGNRVVAVALEGIVDNFQNSLGDNNKLGPVVGHRDCCKDSSL